MLFLNKFLGLSFRAIISGARISFRTICRKNKNNPRSSQKRVLCVYLKINVYVSFQITNDDDEEEEKYADEIDMPGQKFDSNV